VPSYLCRRANWRRSKCTTPSYVKRTRSWSGTKSMSREGPVSGLSWKDWQRDMATRGRIFP